jgi:hypothetical protein
MGLADWWHRDHQVIWRRVTEAADRAAGTPAAAAQHRQGTQQRAWSVCDKRNHTPIRQRCRWCRSALSASSVCARAQYSCTGDEEAGSAWHSPFKLLVLLMGDGGQLLPGMLAERVPALACASAMQ